VEQRYELAINASRHLLKPGISKLKTNQQIFKYIKIVFEKKKYDYLKKKKKPLNMTEKNIPLLRFLR
jgi:hypothetical protein